MERKVFMQNVESLADYLVGLNQQFFINYSKEIDAVIKNKHDYETKGVLKRISIGKLKPVMKIILTENMSDIRIIIPKYVVKIILETRQIEQNYNFFVKQQYLKVIVDLNLYERDFDSLQDYINRQIEDVIAKNIRDIFLGENFDSMNYSLIKGSPVIQLDYEYEI